MIKDKKIQLAFSGSLLLLITSAIVGFVGLPRYAGGPLVIRFDTLADEVTLLGGIGTFYGVLGVVVAMFVINFFLAFVIYKRERFLSYILAFGTLFLSLLFLAVVFTITAIN